MTTQARPRVTTPIRPGDLGTPAGRHLVALDLDGTTIDYQGRLSPAVRDAVAAVIRAGHHLVVATGRALPSAAPIISALGLRQGYVVCSNGAIIAQIDRRARNGLRLIQRITFDPAPVLRVLHGSWSDAHLAVEDRGVRFRVVDPLDQGDLEGPVSVVTWAQLVATAASRVVFRSPTASANDFLALVDRLGLQGTNHSVGYTAWLDVSPDGVSKASALETVRRSLDVDARRTVAVGDQRNDIEMLGWAACGVAMGAAPDEVKAAAALVTAPVEADGLVDVLAAIPPAKS